MRCGAKATASTRRERTHVREWSERSGQRTHPRLRCACVKTKRPLRRGVAALSRPIQQPKLLGPCHATRASITPAAPATLTQPTHDLAPGAAHVARGDIQWVVYLTPCSDSRGYAECIVNIPELVTSGSQRTLRFRRWTALILRSNALRHLAAGS